MDSLGLLAVTMEAVGGLQKEPQPESWGSNVYFILCPRGQYTVFLTSASLIVPGEVILSQSKC